jgi:hypothetical protein
MAMENYHHIMHVILKSLTKTQAQGGFQWQLQYKGQTRTLMFKVPVAIIVGDSLGHDKIVGQYTHYQNVGKLCHYCNCSYQQANKPMFWFTYTKQRHVQWLIKNNDTNSLVAISHHNVCNAFHGVCFGGDSRGVHGATLFEILHANQIGIVKYAKNYFFI